MANYANAKATIAANIYTNHTGQVTAEMVKTAANEIVNTLIAGGYLDAGIAHPGDAAVSPDANVFYIACEPGTFTNKGGLVVADGEVAVLKYNGTWSKEVTGAATAAQVTELGQKVYNLYFGSNKTFGLADIKDSSAIRSSLLKCVFEHPAPARVGIYAFTLSLQHIVISFANCDNLADDDVISSSDRFGYFQTYIGAATSGQVKGTIYKESSLINPIGYAIVDIGLFLEATNYVTSSTPTTFANSGFYFVETNKEAQQITELERQISPVVSLGWGVKLRGNSNSYITPKNAIVLSGNGDSLEIEFGNVLSESFEAGGYAFTLYTGTTQAARGIAVSKSSIRVRFDDGTWAFPAQGFTPTSTFKLVYSNGNVLAYVDNVLVATYTGQKTLSIKSFGNGVNPQYITYWSGVINKIVYNGTTLDLYDDFAWGADVIADRKNGFLSESQAAALVNASVGYAKLYAAKASTRLSLYYHIGRNQYIHYPLNYRQAGYTAGTYPSYYDNWGIGQPSLCTFDGISMTEVATLFNPAEAELAINLPRSGGDESNVYVGGSAHGFENIKVVDGVRQFIILVNGIGVGESATFDLKPIQSAEVVQDTELVQAYANSNPFADARKHWVFNSEGLFITTKVKVIRALAFKQAQFGMFGIFRHWLGSSANDYLTNRAVKDNSPFIVYDVSDGWESDPGNASLRQNDKYCTRISMWGERPLGAALVITNSNVKSNGGMHVGTNSNAYNKIYFDLTGQYTPQVDEELYATQKWEIL